MKKLLALAACAVLLLSLFPSAMAEKDLEPAHLTFWKSPHVANEDEVWANVIAGFNEIYPQITVEFLAVPWDSVNEKEMAAFASHNPPDISFQVEQFQVYAEAGCLVDLNQYMTAEKKAGYNQSVLDYCTYEGQQMGIPFGAADSLMFYNKDIFAAEGITELPTTWEEMIEVAQKCTKDTDGDGAIDQWGLLLKTRPRCDMWQGVTYIQQSGAELWNETRDNIGFNNEAGIRGLQMYADLFNKYQVVPPIDTFSSEEEEKSAFYDGHIAMWPDQVNEYGNILNGNPSLNLGAFLIPAGPAEDEAQAHWSFGNIGMLSIAADSKYPDQAWVFLEYITQPDVERGIVASINAFSPQLATNEGLYAGSEIMSLAADGIRVMQCSPSSKYFQGMWDGVRTMLESLARGAATPEEAIAELETKLAVLAE